MIRLFAALPIPPEIAEGLVRRQHGLTEARWSPAENLHITLRFAGDVAETTAEDLDSELSRVAAEPFDLSLEGVGAFGEGRDIHAIWAGVAESPALKRLAQSCESAARRAGLAADTRAYRPHVTLAYLRRPDPALGAAWIQSNNLLKSPTFRIDRFGLYSSHATKGGSRYQLERLYGLGGN
ncbi:RNA 2',3'-cyclic phosphodiesterase [Phenylobacterium montanum]|uniref:RNA 2',3'-cyclic phosphodiesterase n=1 Tax=Phenylobacterium montanum TaxID=2823693 RepID=A0A975FW03_9CAUL|nr:RNA 2',3'-cyclic phosphodiesterase [Caulobacter sp. S6]QUD86405.1 RNA 2',3'-cyclic phosphodiesterase [Caulobacter sp. S6]